MLREPGKPLVACMVTPDQERRYVGGAFITLNDKVRERLWIGCKVKAPAPKDIKAEPGTEWLTRQTTFLLPSISHRNPDVACDPQLLSYTYRERHSRIYG